MYVETDGYRPNETEATFSWPVEREFGVEAPDPSTVERIGRKLAELLSGPIEDIEATIGSKNLETLAGQSDDVPVPSAAIRDGEVAPGGGPLRYGVNQAFGVIHDIAEIRRAQLGEGSDSPEAPDQIDLAA